MMSKKFLVTTIILTCFAALPILADSGVRVWEEPLVIPTYRVGDPDPNPIFYTGRAYQGAKGPVYPYPMLDKLTDTREDRSYTAVYLENRYVKICVLPEIGGRILYAVDKTNGYDMFYRQHVIKPALIGMLGAWISGGVEWCIPHHHRATTFMPVDYTMVENPDGSKTVWVGEMELRHRMKWIIGITLHPDKSIVEATVKLFNRTPIVHSFLYWANVAVHTNPEYQVIFPPSTEFATYHGKNQFSRWPVSEEVYHRVDYTRGVDVSWWKNHPEPTSMFAWNCREDFFAGYDHGKEAGVVHVADHEIVPGKKFWTWGTGSRGQIWEKILTETDGPYLELMVGGYSDNQPDYSWIQPYEVKILEQVWYPLRKMGGVKNANREAAVNLEITPEGFAEMGFNTTSAYGNAKVILRVGKKVLHEQTIDISPEKPFWKRIALPDDTKGEDLQLTLFSSSNEELIAYIPVKKARSRMPEPVKPPSDPEDIKSTEELYLTGLRLEQFYNPAFEPYPYFQEVLRRDPGDSRTNTALGILDCKRGLFKEAAERLKRAVERVTKNYTRPRDGEALYYLGIALRALGEFDAASDAFYRATWDAASHSAAHYQLAELSCREGDFTRALDHLSRSLSTNVKNTRAQNLKAVILRKTGRLSEAEEVASRIISSDPLDFWAGNELILLKSAMGAKTEALEALNELRVKMRDEVQSYLELAVDYGNCGFWDESVRVLMRLIESGDRGAKNHPMVYYYIGYFYEKMGKNQKALEYYRTASKRPPDNCFPFRWESVDVLQHAARFNPDDVRAPYYLGNLLYDHQPENAIRQWERSRDLDGTFAVVHRNLGLAYGRVENNIPKAIRSLEKAVACCSEDPRFFYELDQLYEMGGESPQKRYDLLKKHHKSVVKRDDALSREIMLGVQLGKYDEAIELLRGHHFHTWEGGGRIHNVYVDAYLLRGYKKFKDKNYLEALNNYRAALEYPENLEVGRPTHDRKIYKTYYFMGRAFEGLEDRTKAMVYYERAAEREEIPGWSEIRYYQGEALRRLGREDEAKELFNGLMSFGKENLRATPSMDFFAKFGEKQSRDKQMANAHYLVGLGYLGSGDGAEAKASFEKALQLDGNHLWARVHLNELK